MEKSNQLINIVLIISVLLLCLGPADSLTARNLFRLFPNTNTAVFTAASECQQRQLSNKKPRKPKSKSVNSKKVTFETFEENYQKALHFYDNQMFVSAARIFEELYPLSLGTPRADSILYLFADCYYNNRDYEMAAFHFKEYAGKYSTNPRAEDAHYKSILALSHLSPEYSLDQTDTYYVIEEIQLFIQKYPYSSRMDECNALLDQMRNKLALKAFEILKLYYNTENYRSAQIAAKNFLKEYSASQYADDAYAILVRNNYDFAQKSVENKKVERYLLCIDAFESMKMNYPNSPLIREVEKFASDAKNKVNKTESKKSKTKDKKNED